MGRPIAEPLIENPVFTPLVSQMVKIGEEVGELQKMPDKIADFYEDEASIASLTSIIEPIMIMGVGAIIGIILIAMYLPIQAAAARAVGVTRDRAARSLGETARDL